MLICTLSTHIIRCWICIRETRSFMICADFGKPFRNWKLYRRKTSRWKSKKYGVNFWTRMPVVPSMSILGPTRLPKKASKSQIDGVLTLLRYKVINYLITENWKNKTSLKKRNLEKLVNFLFFIFFICFLEMKNRKLFVIFKKNGKMEKKRLNDPFLVNYYTEFILLYRIKYKCLNNFYISTFVVIIIFRHMYIIWWKVIATRDIYVRKCIRIFLMDLKKRYFLFSSWDRSIRDNLKIYHYYLNHVVKELLYF